MKDNTYSKMTLKTLDETRTPCYGKRWRLTVYTKEQTDELVRSIERILSSHPDLTTASLPYHTDGTIEELREDWSVSCPEFVRTPLHKLRRITENLRKAHKLDHLKKTPKGRGQSSGKERIGTYRGGDYVVYLASHYWRWYSRTTLEKYPTCRMCLGESTQVHHCFYLDKYGMSVLGREVTCDACMALCAFCHEKLHKNIKYHRIVMGQLKEALKQLNNRETPCPQC